MKTVHLLRKFGRKADKTSAGVRDDLEGLLDGQNGIETKIPQPNARMFLDQKGQVSAEMLIIIAALIAVAMVLIGQLQTSAKTGAKNLGQKTDAAWKEVDQIGK